MENGVIIDLRLVRRLIAEQFPIWKDLPLSPVARSGWDNKTFHLGPTMLVRLPSREHYAQQVEKEQFWLPKLAPYLPLEIPKPLALGKPADGYSWNWSVYRWLDGEAAAVTEISNLSEFAVNLAQFLMALQKIDTSGGPFPGLHSFYRGGSLTHYDLETRQAIAVLSDKIDADLATAIWERALTTSLNHPPVWVHGDISLGNLLIKRGRLSAVIDFGQMAIGDPACDLAIAWTLFTGESREMFRSTFSFDKEMWLRGRAWTLWKALRTAAGFTNPNNAESAKCWHIIKEVLEDDKGN